VLAYNGIAGISMQKKEKIKVFIDEGNNSRLINELMRRRSNLKIISSKKDANIVWTQFCDW
jgi:transcription antitermination factor NusA-like protein